MTRKSLRQEEKESRLRRNAARLGWELKPSAAARMLAYLEALLLENRRLNLTGVTDPEEALQRHLLDSLALGLHLSGRGAPPPAHLLDLGTGGGFPGVPLAAALPETTVHLVESRGRKVQAVARLCEQAGIANIVCHHCRARDLAGSKALPSGAPDIILVRAVGSLEKIIAEAAPIMPPGGELVCWKSLHLTPEERSRGAAAARRRGLQPLEDIPYETDRRALLVRYRKPMNEGGSP